MITCFILLLSSFTMAIFSPFRHAKSLHTNVGGDEHIRERMKYLLTELLEQRNERNEIIISLI